MKPAMSGERSSVRPASDPLVIARTDDGFRVYAAADPSHIYHVTGTPHMWTCTCPDFRAGNGRKTHASILAPAGTAKRGNRNRSVRDSRAPAGTARSRAHASIPKRAGGEERCTRNRSSNGRAR